MQEDVRVVVKGAGDLATGVGARLWRSGMQVLMTELERPLTIRRTAAFSEAVYDGETRVEDLTARRVAGVDDVYAAWEAGAIPVLVDSSATGGAAIRPHVLVDAILAKRNLGTRITRRAAGHRPRPRLHCRPRRPCGYRNQPRALSRTGAVARKRGA